jgi:ribonuclease Z
MLLIELTSNYGEHLAIGGLPEKIQIMASNLYMNMRPPAPPIIENLPGDGDRFHPAVKKSSSLDLSPLTSEKFAAARLNVTNAIEKGIDVPKGAGVGVLPLGTGSALPSKYRNGWCTNLF